MSSAPLPSTLTLLSQLPKHEVGSKVRFLGCVASYDTRKGILDLRHSHLAPPETAIRACVDVNLLLENCKRENLEIGAWVNIMGYVQEVEQEQKNRSYVEKAWTGTVKDRTYATPVKVQVQAIMLWGGGAIEISAYENAVNQRMSCGK